MRTSLRLCVGSAIAVSCLGAPGAALADVNVAPGGTAFQSTTANGGDASRAIDGNTNGDYGAGSVTHTDPADAAPYWQVDLGREIELSRIVLWNRTGCCPERLTAFRISILDGNGTEVEGDDFFTDLSFPDTTLAGFEWTIPVPVLSQTVRVDRLGPDITGLTILSLAEVQVFSDKAPPVITKQPKGGKAYVGGKLTFTVEAVGADPLSYRWKKGTDEIGGATSSTLTLDPVKLTDGGTYTVSVTNAVDTATSDPADLRVFAGRNLARDGEASQSSEAAGGVPSRAIDGNTGGAFFAGSVTHTADGDAAPWWEVLLYGPSTLDTIFIWNRTDCCAERLHNFRVLVLDADRLEVWHDDFFTDGTFPDTTLDGFEIPLPAATLGQIVRVEHLGSLNGAPLVLSLAEVEVIGDGPRPPPDPNLARREGATATQSSDYAGGIFPAVLAINGSLDDFTHTDVGQNLPATWEVDLGAEGNIEEIVLWNRRNCCGSRLRDITVSVLNLAGDAVLFQSDLLNPENSLGAYPDGPAKLSLNLFELTGGFVRGGRVRVVREPDPDLSGTQGQGNEGEPDVLSLAEVQVFEPVTCPAQGDTHCLPFSFKVEGPLDGGPGNYTAAARGSDDSGDAIRYTYTLDNGKLPPRAIGPQATPQASFRLGVGNWTISVTADDNLRCDDQAADASCSKQVTVSGKPNNKAPLGIATQSSITFEGDPNRAIDGITDGNWGGGSVTHTSGLDAMPWWQVDLGAEYEIDRVVLWNRTDCCAGRLTRLRISLLDGVGAEAAGEDLFTDLSFPDTTLDGFEWLPPFSTVARAVHITKLGADLEGTTVLSLAEVEVYCPAGPKENCTNDTDDDGDAKVDCADEDCAAAPACLGKTFHRGDSDGNGQLQLTDAVRILNVLFLGTGVIPLPGPTSEPCGIDPTDDGPQGDLGCSAYASC